MDIRSVISGEEKLKKLFYPLPKQEIQKINIIHYKKGETLLFAGEHPRYIYIILDGICVLTKETRVSSCPQAIGKLGYTDVIGVYEVIRNIRRMASVYAYTDCSVAAIEKELCEKWIDEYPRFMLGLCLDVHNRHYASQDYANYYSRYSVDCAVISFLLSEWELYTRKNTRKQQNIKLDCTRKAISEAVGHDLRSVNRTIKRLKSEDLILLERGKICLNEEKAGRLELIREKEMDGKNL